MSKTLLLDIVAPEEHQNDRSYVRELSTFDLLCKNLVWWVVTQRTSKNHKIGGGLLHKRLSVRLIIVQVQWVLVGS